MTWEKIKGWAVSIFLGSLIWAGLTWARQRVNAKVAADQKCAAVQERIAVALERLAKR